MSTQKLENNTIIITLEEQLLSAMKNCDIQKLNELIHEDLLFNLPNGQTITKVMDLETYSLGNMKIDNILSNEQIINLLEHNAIISVIIAMKGTFFNHIIDVKYRVLRVWKKINSNWKIIAGSSNSL